MQDDVKVLVVRPGWRRPPAAPRPLHLTPRDVRVLRWCADWRVAATADLLQAGRFPSIRAGHVRLSALYRGGLLTSTRLRWRGRVTVAWTLTPEGAAAVAACDAAWTGPPPPAGANQPPLRHHLYHDLGRSSLTAAFLTAAAARGLDAAAWPAMPLALPGRANAMWQPDGAWTCGPVLWLLEYERSWRRNTLQRKLQQFAAALRGGAWRDWWPRAPRLLVVAESAGTQAYRLDTWLADALATTRGTAAVLLLDAALDGSWTRVDTGASWWDAAAR
jgi:hypothetical protein